MLLVLSVCALFVSLCFQTCTIDLIHVTSFHNGTVFPTCFGAANCPTPSSQFINVLVTSRVVVVRDFDRGYSLEHVEFWSRAASEPGYTRRPAWGGSLSLHLSLVCQKLLLRVTSTERCPCEAFFVATRARHSRWCLLVLLEVSHSFGEAEIPGLGWVVMTTVTLSQSTRREYPPACHLFPTTLAREALLCFLHGEFTTVLLCNTASRILKSFLSCPSRGWYSCCTPFGVRSKQITQVLSVPVCLPYRVFVRLHKFVRLVLLFRGFCPGGRQEWSQRLVALAFGQSCISLDFSTCASQMWWSPFAWPSSRTCSAKEFGWIWAPECPWCTKGPQMLFESTLPNVTWGFTLLCNCPCIFSCISSSVDFVKCSIQLTRSDW